MRNASNTIVQLFIVSSVMALLTTVGCKKQKTELEDAKSQNTELSKELEEAKKEIQDVRRVYREEVNMAIQENRKLLLELREMAREGTKLAIEESKSRLIKLEEQNEDIQKRLNEYVEGGKEEWDEFKNELNHDLEVLGKALKDFTTDNRRKEKKPEENKNTSTQDKEE